ncbi:uncharacterized protein SPPG_08337 [Spizellomyces punctatus DAOM BR117]|uniref:Protein with SprT-like domain at the N terminus n=1 Tax=Spizellomyces punctatus (strain DAOM BR117) TaxID=645134 RepID=A0A0L0H4Q6_SPIPD|nr:uncharacterized protein SPPG_08337 [Spizellomyces punctatus DAOM BR117]KNC96182.1 hypothetical protein SPPG_08337 [Spizellomyces punctatus DAOM BR117]|eukprot:XP_016604222.1 hypothetical protein SPPG_08337 [Spizellomyces punctatus DAOM BR117]
MADTAFDESLALLLQQEEDELAAAFASQGGSNAHAASTRTSDVADPNPDLHALFLAFDQQYFDGRLASVEVRWSDRMTLCAGMCYYYKGGYCSIRLSEPLLKFRPRSDYINTLLHEMIHAYLFVTQNNRDREGHGPEFLKLAERINKQAGTNITVYHNFHDEVNHYRVHVWKCDGPCQHRPPFFGIVRRSMNRPPQPADRWWSDHQASCGGTYHKIAGPEPKPKRKRKEEKSEDRVDKGKTAGIDDYFVQLDKKIKSEDDTRQNDKVRAPSPHHSELVMDLTGPPLKPSKEPIPSAVASPPESVSCPVCGKTGFTSTEINEHLDLCLWEQGGGS